MQSKGSSLFIFQLSSSGKDPGLLTSTLKFGQPGVHPEQPSSLRPSGLLLLLCSFSSLCPLSRTLSQCVIHFIAISEPAGQLSK